MTALTLGLAKQRPLPMIKLITFDLDNTLWNNHIVMQRCIPKVNSWIADQVPESVNVTTERVGQIRSELIDSAPQHAHRVSWLRLHTYINWFTEAGLSPASAKLAAEQAFDVFWRDRINVQPFDGVAQRLQQLSEKTTLAVITNGNSSLAHAGLAQYFSASFFADHMPAAKPDPVALVTAMAMFNARPEQTLHVGDSYTDDIEMAINVGANALWLNEGDMPPPLGWHAKDPDEMFDMIDAMLAASAD